MLLNIKLQKSIKLLEPYIVYTCAYTLTPVKNKSASTHNGRKKFTNHKKNYIQQYPLNALGTD